MDESKFWGVLLALALGLVVVALVWSIGHPTDHCHGHLCTTPAPTASVTR